MRAARRAGAGRAQRSRPSPSLGLLASFDPDGFDRARCYAARPRAPGGCARRYRPVARLLDLRNLHPRASRRRSACPRPRRLPGQDSTGPSACWMASRLCWIASAVPHRRSLTSSSFSMCRNRRFRRRLHRGVRRRPRRDLGQLSGEPRAAPRPRTASLPPASRASCDRGRRRAASAARRRTSDLRRRSAAPPRRSCRAHAAIDFPLNQPPSSVSRLSRAPLHVSHGT